MTTYKSRPGPYGKQRENGEAMSEELRRQSDLQMGQLIQEVKNIGITLTTMQTDIKTLQEYMHTNKGFFSGLRIGLRSGVHLGLLVIVGGIGAAGREILSKVAGWFQ